MQQTKKLSRKVISYVLALVMVLSTMTGIVPGMSMTAQAASPYEGIINTTNAVKFAEQDWYLIEYDENENTVTLFLKDVFAESKYGSNTTYSGSTIEGVVNAWYEQNIPTDYREAVSGGMFLLTTDQANNIDVEVRKCSYQSPQGAGYSMYWLDQAVFVNNNTGRIAPRSVGPNDYTLGVRPALKLDLSKVTFDSENKKFSLGSPKTNQTVTAPTAASNLTYTGQELALLTGGASVSEGNGNTEATIQYSLTPTDDNSWVDSYTAVKATNAGEYKVYYRVAGNDTYADFVSSDEQAVPVTITPADKTALNDAIAAAKAYYDTIKGNTDYNEAADKLDKAIKAAEEVAVKDKVTKSEVSTATEAVNTAKTTAEAEVKDIDDIAAAKKVTDAINALPASNKVATTDKAAIEAARKAYDALTADQKKKVSADTLKKLTDAENALKAAEAAEKAAKALAAAKKEAQAAMNEQVTVTQKGKKITVKWKKAKSADGYYVYAQYCGKKFKKPVKNIKKNSITKLNIKKINGKKINLKKQFKVYVLTYKKVNGKKVVLAKSNVGHIVGVKNKKFTNVKTLKLKKKTYTVEVGKTANVKAKVTIVDKSKKHIASKHIAKFRYRTSDESIATVSKKGKIKGISKGKCKIYVYAANGKMKKATVTVK